MTILILTVILFQQGLSQTFDLRFVEVSYTGTTCDIKIEINSNQSAFALGTSSLVFTYSTSELNNPTVQTIHNYSGGNYLPLVVNVAQPPRVAINIELGVAPGLQVPILPTDVVTIRFTKLIPAQATLQWVTGGGAPTVVFKDDETTIVPAESLINLNCCPLPVQLASFTATVVNGTRVHLDWRTISEVNNYGFYVEKKWHGDSTFTEIPNSFVPGHGTTNEPRNYTFTDESPGAATVWYRLRQVDLDGTRHYSEPIMASGILVSVNEKEAAPMEFALQQNYPNPFNPSTEIKFSVEKTAHATLDIFNLLGQLVATLFNGVANAGYYHRVTFQPSHLGSGVYFYRLQSGDNISSKRMVLIR